MAKNPEQRYRSARAFSRELRHWLDENTVSSDSDLPVVPEPRRRGLWIAMASIGVLLAGVALWGLTARDVTPAAPVNASTAQAAPVSYRGRRVGTAAAERRALAAGDQHWPLSRRRRRRSRRTIPTS